MPRAKHKTVSMMGYVNRVAEDVHRGRLQDAVSAILALPKTQAVVVASYVFDQVNGGPNYSAFLRVLESHFDD